MDCIGWFTEFDRDSKNESNEGKTGFDGGMRQMAMEFAQTYQAWLTYTQLMDISDALAGSTNIACNLTQNIDLYQSRKYEARIYNEFNIVNENNRIILFVDIEHGNDEKYNGSKLYPFKTIQHAIVKSRNYKYKTILIREGRYYIANPIYFTALDSNLFI